MNRAAWILLAASLAAGITLYAQRRGQPDSSSLPMARNAAEKQIIGELDRMVRSRETYLSVPVKDGKALRMLAEAANAQHVVEVGTSTGYSGLWLCLALVNTGGKLTTFEVDSGRAEQARRNFEAAGCADRITVVVGDAHRTVAQVEGPVDLVFIDADKEGYLDYLEKLLPKVRLGGWILAHNITSAPEYVRAVQGNAGLETIFYMDGNGMGVTLKKR
jgi:caffeoyl-CoA O-methyltransferase